MDPPTITEHLIADMGRLKFGAPITHVYNPLVYAERPWATYLARYGTGRRRVVMLGMNPGPWGMAQTGVPFGDPAMVRDWLGIEEPVAKPSPEHPKRPVEGFACRRSEVSGTRLWSWARDMFKTPKRFFQGFFVANYCPLVFMEASGRNFTPDKLPAKEREPLLEACDRGLRRLVEYFAPEVFVGIGAFAETRARKALEGMDVAIGRILHPSPASPAANRGWADKATAELRALGVHL